MFEIIWNTKDKMELDRRRSEDPYTIHETIADMVRCRIFRDGDQIEVREVQFGG